MKDGKVKWYDKKFVVIIWLILFWPVGLIALAMNKTIRKVPKIILFVIFGLWGLIITLAIFIPSDAESLNNNISQSIQNEKNTFENTIEYTIVEAEDISMKALGNKILSDYSTAELEALPQNKRMSYRIVVPSTIKEAQVLPTVQEIINNITTSDNDIDQIALFLYSDPEVINGMYDVAKAEWAPKGEWGNVTPEIARNNDRSSYKINLQIKSELESYLENRNSSEIKFGFSVEERRAIFIELVETEDKATRDADEKYPIVATGTMEDLKKNANYNDERLKKYESEIREKYGLTEEQESEISLEGLLNNWPMGILAIENTDSNNNNSSSIGSDSISSTNSSVSASEAQALRQAKSYLDYSAFSKQGLIEQLEYEGFSTSDATYGTEKSGADWNIQAVKNAKSYLDNSAFSKSGLIEQLKYEGFSDSEATYGGEKSGANWNLQAEKSAKSYIDNSAFSRSSLIEQLEYEGFTSNQAIHGVNSVGL
jgi:hypothetical protein